MKYKLFAFYWIAVLAVLSVVFGLLALVGVPNVEVIFWSSDPIVSSEGQIAWIIGWLVILIILIVLIIKESKKRIIGNDK